MFSRASTLMSWLKIFQSILSLHLLTYNSMVWQDSLLSPLHQVLVWMKGRWTSISPALISQSSFWFLSVGLEGVIVVWVEVLVVVLEAAVQERAGFQRLLQQAAKQSTALASQEARLLPVTSQWWHWEAFSYPRTVFHTWWCAHLVILHFHFFQSSWGYSVSWTTNDASQLPTMSDETEVQRYSFKIRL